MHALPRQHASHSDEKQYQSPRRKIAAAARSHKGGRTAARASVLRERALDLGNAGGDRASPSLTRPPDPCAIPAISIAAVPQQQRDQNREITGTDRACPAGAQRIAAGKAQSAFFSRES